MMWKLLPFCTVLATCIIAKSDIISAIATGHPGQFINVTTADTPKCQEDLPKYNDCPMIDIDKNINQHCCDNRILICISYYDKHGVQHIYTECSEDMLIPKGCYLDVLATGSGIKERIRTCEAGRYEPNDRMASEVRHNYCTETKTHCTKEGQQPLCQGGPAADDQCICADGYHPEGWPAPSEQCKDGFGEDAICFCVPAECPMGTTRNNNFSSEGMCDSQTIHIDYNCHETSADSTSSTQATPPMTTQKKTNEESNHSLLYLLFLIPVFLVLMLFFKYGKPLKQKMNSLIRHKSQDEDKSPSDPENAMLPQV